MLLLLLIDDDDDDDDAVDENEVTDDKCDKHESEKLLICLIHEKRLQRY